MKLCKAPQHRDLEIVGRCLREPRAGGRREVGMVKIVAMERRDGIGMRNEIVLARKRAHDRAGDGAGVVLRAWG